MSELQIGGQSAITQAGSDPPELASGVTGGSGLDAVAINAANLGSGVLPVGVTGGSGLNAIEGTNLKSTGQSGGDKILQEDGSGGVGWATPAAGGESRMPIAGRMIVAMVGGGGSGGSGWGGSGAGNGGEVVIINTPIGAASYSVTVGGNNGYSNISSAFAGFVTRSANAGVGGHDHLWAENVTTTPNNFHGQIYEQCRDSRGSPGLGPSGAGAGGDGQGNVWWPGMAGPAHTSSAHGGRGYVIKEIQYAAANNLGGGFTNTKGRYGGGGGGGNHVVSGYSGYGEGTDGGGRGGEYGTPGTAGAANTGGGGGGAGGQSGSYGNSGGSGGSGVLFCVLLAGDFTISSISGGYSATLDGYDYIVMLGSGGFQLS